MDGEHQLADEIHVPGIRLDPGATKGAREESRDPVHGDPAGEFARFFTAHAIADREDEIHAREFGAAWLHLMRTHAPAMYPDADRPSLFHIVGEERSNLDVARIIADLIGKPLKYELVNFHASRPGHDLRYALDGTKLAEDGWRPARKLEETLADIVAWYLDHPAWLEPKQATA